MTKRFSFSSPSIRSSHLLSLSLIYTSDGRPDATMVLANINEFHSKLRFVFAVIRITTQPKWSWPKLLHVDICSLVRALFDNYSSFLSFCAVLHWKQCDTHIHHKLHIRNNVVVIVATLKSSPLGQTIEFVRMPFIIIKLKSQFPVQRSNHSAKWKCHPDRHHEHTPGARVSMSNCTPENDRAKKSGSKLKVEGGSWGWAIWHWQ